MIKQDCDSHPKPTSAPDVIVDASSKNLAGLDDELKAFGSSSVHQNTMVGDPTADSFTINNQNVAGTPGGVDQNLVDQDYIR